MFQIGEDSVDFDEEEEFKEETKVSLEDLNGYDSQMLGQFDITLASAMRNAEKGDLNQEMAKAQTQELYETLKSLEQNIAKENDRIKNENDEKKVTAFVKKVDSVA